MVKYNSDELDVIFSALADPTRRAILDALSTGPASVTELAEPFQISLPAISRHLAVLREAGLIESEKDGRIHRMHLRMVPLQQAVAWLERHEKFWNERLEALDDMLASKKQSRD